MSDPGKTSARLSFLDCVRGLAAAAVLFEHAGYRTLPNFRIFTHQYFSFGKFGLTAFFLVSGFVIPLSIEKTRNLALFWWYRLFRLYPVYWVSLGAIVLLSFVGCSTELTPAFRNHLLRNTAMNITMLQGFMGAPHAIGLYYTLTIEMAFYFACTVLVLLGLFRHSRAIAWTVLLFCSTAWMGIPLVLQKRVEMAGLFYVVTLFIGTAIYRFYQGRLSFRRLSCLLGWLAVSSLVGIWLNYVRYPKSDPMEHYSFTGVVLPWMAGYVFFLSAYYVRARSFPWLLSLLGAISYSIYVLHPIVLGIFLPNDIADGQHARLAALGLLLACVIAVSWVTFTYIEKPMIQLGRKLGDWRHKDLMDGSFPLDAGQRFQLRRVQL
jgi:peptidoglycan/LPS O-acetylase OafA/YrhL